MTTLGTGERSVVDQVKRGLFINGEWRDATGGAGLPVEDPSNGETLCDVADASPEDGLAALDAASSVQTSWAASAPRERGEILRRAFARIMEWSDDLALLMTLEMGKPLAESKAEIGYAASSSAGPRRRRYGSTAATRWRRTGRVDCSR